MLDPTLLLTADHYVQLFSSKKPHSHKGQLLAYVLDRSEDKIRVIDTLSKRLSVNAYSTNGQPFGPAIPADAEGDKTVEGWLAAIHDAAFVVTDLFHGTVFSILFNRPFMAYGNPKRGLARFISLLKMFGLEDRLLAKSAEFDLEKMLQPIDWNTVNTRLEKLRAESKQFLVSALCGDIPSSNRASQLSSVVGDPVVSHAAPTNAIAATNAVAATNTISEKMQLGI